MTDKRFASRLRAHVKWSFPLGLWLIIAMGLAAILLLRFRGVADMQDIEIYDIAQDLFGILLCAEVYYGCMNGRSRNEKTTRLFAALLLNNASLLFFDQCAWMFRGDVSHRPLVLLFNVLYYVNGRFLNYQLWVYVSRSLKLDDAFSRRANKLLRDLLIPVLLLSLANLFIPVYFVVDEQAIYRRANLFPLSYGYFIITLVALVVGLSRSRAPKKQKHIALSIVVLPIINVVLTFVAYGLSTQYVMVLVSIVLLYSVLYSEQNDKLAATESELGMATRIQANILPSLFPAFPDRKEFGIYATMDPAKEVGGDFYDFFFVDDNHLAVVVADVSGKGVPAALFMMTARTMLKDATLTGADPAKALKRVNARLCENNKDGMFVTVWLGVLEISTGILTYADAGHEKLLACLNGKWQFLPKGKAPALAFAEPEELDEMPEQYQFQNETLRLSSGDAVFQYTDGVTEATYDVNAGEGAAETMFGEERLLDALNEKPDAAPEELLPLVRSRIDTFVDGGEQFDDITMLALRYRGCR